MTVELVDKIYPLYITLGNNLLVIKERTRKIENITDQRELIRECECLYESCGRIEYVMKKMLSLTESICQHPANII